MDSRPEIILTPDDRRDSLRQPAMNVVEIEVELIGGEHHTAEIVDVSRTGLRLRSTYCFRCGSIVTLKPPTGSDLPACRAQIMRQIMLKNQGPENFEYGFQFLDMETGERHSWFLRLRRREAA